MTQADRHHKHRQIADQKVALATLASEPKFSAAVISIINTTTIMLPRVLCRHRDLFISFGSSRFAAHVVHDVKHGEQVRVDG